MVVASRRFCLGLAACAALLGGCGGGGGGNKSGSGFPGSLTYDWRAAMANALTTEESLSVKLSGTVTINGVAMAVSGTGTYSRAPASSATFNGASALAQVVAISGTLAAGGQTSPYSSSSTEFHDPISSAWLGEDDGAEYDVATSPIEFPTAIGDGSSGILGIVSRYTDSSMGVPLGTARISYSAAIPPWFIATLNVTTKYELFDTRSRLTETDTYEYSFQPSGKSGGWVLSFVSATLQSGADTLTIKP